MECNFLPNILCFYELRQIMHIFYLKLIEIKRINKKIFYF